MANELSIILASGSQRRREIIEVLDAGVEIVPSGIDEGPASPDERAEEYVARMAADKARAVAANGRSGSLVIGADTSVVLDGQVLGKPEDEAEAWAMLTSLRGRSHRVVTAVTVARDGMAASSVTSSEVAMREYSEAEIEAFIESGKPFDKAGGYAIQDGEFSPVSTLNGCYLNVVGFPLCEVMRLMSEVGADIRIKEGWRAPERCPGDCPVGVAGETAVR